MHESTTEATTLDMAKAPHYDVALWQVHETEDDCDIIIRTNNGGAFYCNISPSRFHRSPRVTEQYFNCLDLLRSGEEEKDDFYMEDACDWLSKPFQPLIAQLAPGTATSRRPTLSQYLFPPHFVCTLEATDEKLHPLRLNTQEHGWAKPMIIVNDDYLRDLDQWTRSYHPNDIELGYNRAQDVLIRRPTKVRIINGSGDEGYNNSPTTYFFFKRFELSFGARHAKAELKTCKKVAMAHIPPPPEAWICRLHGVVRDGTNLFGMLFTWIDAKGVLSGARAAQSSAQLRRHWAASITASLEKLHQADIVWGDAKAENILIDRDDNAWIIDFGGSYTVGWVDKDKAGTVEGDRQGLAKILDILH